MVKSGYPIYELKKICFEEVSPVLYTNLHYDDWFQPDEEWLFKQILIHLQKQKINPIYSAWVQTKLAKYFMKKPISQDWDKIVEIYKETKKKN